MLNELDALVNIDLDRRQIKKEHTSLNLVRIGTSGSLQADIPVDSFVMAKYGLGFDGVLHAYKTDDLFDSLERLPFSTFINIGLESADPQTLVEIRKSITAKMVEEAFSRMLDINRRYDKIEISANFLFGDHLPERHLTSFMALMEKLLKHPYGKGAIYFSPLVEGGTEENRGLVRKFYKVKTLSHLATYIYLIQRL